MPKTHPIEPQLIADWVHIVFHFEWLHVFLLFVISHSMMNSSFCFGFSWTNHRTLGGCKHNGNWEHLVYCRFQLLKIKWSSPIDQGFEYWYYDRKNWPVTTCINGTVVLLNWNCCSHYASLNLYTEFVNRFNHTVQICILIRNWQQHRPTYVFINVNSQELEWIEARAEQFAIRIGRRISNPNASIFGRTEGYLRSDQQCRMKVERISYFAVSDGERWREWRREVWLKGKGRYRESLGGIFGIFQNFWSVFLKKHLSSDSLKITLSVF